ncbi:MAG: lysophospholipid acyltransferase family protein [Longimicrobiales bacterium]|nr:lysophospholipid acyltransferase family protein [Longimicrobiales bacterium]
MNELIFRGVGVLGGGVVRALHATCRITVEGDAHWQSLAEAGRGWIWCLWHGTMLTPIWRHRDEGAVALVSEHRDGEYLARILEELGVVTVRGSSTRGGSRGVRALLRAAQDGRVLAVTPDGPRGPRERLKPGALFVAMRTGLPLVPIGVGVSRAWRTDSWDRFTVPQPGARIHIRYGRPIDPGSIPGGAEGRANEEVQAALDAVTRAARGEVEER